MGEECLRIEYTMSEDKTPSLDYTNNTVQFAGIKDFPQFNDLPAELRIKIWKQALPEPRMVFVMRERPPQYAPSLDLKALIDGFDDIEDITIESMRLVCRDSNDIVMSRYSSTSLFREPRFHYTWLDYRQDTVILETNVFTKPEHDFCRCVCREIPKGIVSNGFGAKKVEHLALRQDFLDGYDERHELISEVLSKFSGLKSLTVIARYFTGTDVKYNGEFESTEDDLTFIDKKSFYSICGIEPKPGKDIDLFSQEKELAVSMKLLERIRSHRVASGEADWKIPEIQWKICWPAWMAKGLGKGIMRLSFEKIPGVSARCWVLQDYPEVQNEEEGQNFSKEGDVDT